MSNFLDANVWLALSWKRHEHWDLARRWYEEAGEEQFFVCRFTQLTVLRLLTTEKVMREDCKTMAEAWGFWEFFTERSRIELLPEPHGLDLPFRAHSLLSTRSPKVWADAYLLAFASAAGLRLVTFDRALKSRDVDVLVLPITA